MIEQLSLREGFNVQGLLNSAPNFPKDFLYYKMKNLWSELNCLGYALGYRGNDYRDHYFRAMQNISNPSHTLESIPEHLAYTNVKPIAENDIFNIPEGHYPIAGFICPTIYSGTEFIAQHWYRMDSDGLWSHKLGWEAPQATKVDVDNEIILDPRKANRELQGKSYSVFVGFYAVPKGGAEFFETRRGAHQEITDHVQFCLQQHKQRPQLRLVK